MPAVITKTTPFSEKKLHQQRKKEQKISLIFLLAIEKQTHTSSLISQPLHLTVYLHFFF